MKLSVRRIVLLVLSIFVLGFGLYNIISTIVALPAAREMVLEIFSDPQFSSIIANPEGFINVVLGLAVVFSCVGAAFYFATGILCLLAALGKYKGGAHIVLTWIYLVMCALGLLISVVALIKAAQFDWTIILDVLRVGVAIASLIIAKRIKSEEEY